MPKLDIEKEPIYSPTEYIKLANLNHDITDHISIEEFDIIVADGDGLWNYCLDDESEIEGEYVPVRFANGVIRLVELPEQHN